MSKITPYSEPQPDVAILLENVSVQYRIPSEAIGTFKEYIIRLVQGKIKHSSFLALKDINLEIKQGEIFGILGRNGAGKSTLLKVISRVLIPGEGRLWINGTVSPLLQLGAGFHPELTGRENIYLNATLLGHTRKEVNNKIDEIIDFAEIGDFIEAPIRTYSSGMNARLGFAVATAWKPDILILDEVLSVGDVAFQEKCITRMTAFRESGATVVIVSHSVDQVRAISQRVMWLDRGMIQSVGATDEVCDEYLHALGR
ncbi:MAG TPA: teichoic acid ABC transporter ATP-binding protein [Anaerolineaceae bacterium]|jgi:ABC-type polysaccharide/polyol phosphate transport system ATPase subunit|nr:teichoic acid ABC transporter ATP-binding protein [Anaerolineaceae bacterium]